MATSALDLGDLTLRFTHATDGYLVQDARSGAACALPASLVLSGSQNGPPRWPRQLTRQDARAAGERLRDALFDGEIRASYVAAQRASLAAGRPLNLRLDLSSAKELEDVPWELLAEPEPAQGLVVLRDIDAPRAGEAAPARPVRILAVLANPGDLVAFDLDREWEDLQQAVQKPADAGTLVLARLSEASVACLERELSERPYQILHFLGHGHSNPDLRYGSVAFEGEGGRAHAMTAEALSVRLAQNPALRLAVLSPGAADEPNSFAQTARTLVRNNPNLDAVLAMRQRLSGSGALAFYRQLYGSLADGTPIDQSVTRARQALAKRGGENEEWDVPHLYAAAQVGRALAPAPESPPADDVPAPSTSEPRHLRPVESEVGVGTNTSKIADPTADESQTQEAEKVPLPPLKSEKLKYIPVTRILALAADPSDASRLRLEEEMRDIKEVFRGARFRNKFKFESCQAARPRDLQQAMLDVAPHIVHFCGHGAGAEGLVLEDDLGRARLVPTDALVNLFGLFADSVECVVLNSCHSEIQATAIAQRIRYVVGMHSAIEDRTAISFATGFYSALGAGYGIPFAYRTGRSAIELLSLPGPLIPVLLQR